MAAVQRIESVQAWLDCIATCCINDGRELGSSSLVPALFSQAVVPVGWLIALAIVVVLSWLGWRWNQLECAESRSVSGRLVKRMRRHSRRRKHHH